MSDSDRQRKALVIEDDEQMAQLVAYVLQNDGYDVRIAPDGATVRDILDVETPPMLVTLDFMLPDASGLDLLATIRAKPAWEGVPVLMLSAKSQQHDIDSALRAGASAFLKKPFKPGELRAEIQRLAPADRGASGGETT